MTVEAHGQVMLTDRAQLQTLAVFKEPEGGNKAEAAWRGMIWVDDHEVYRGPSFWTRSQAWENMFIANEENGWGAVLKAPLPDEASV